MENRSFIQVFMKHIALLRTALGLGDSLPATLGQMWLWVFIVLVLGACGITAVPPPYFMHFSISFRVCEDLALSVLQKHHICVLRICLFCYLHGIMGFLGGSDSKESTCNAADLHLIPGWGSSLVESESEVTQSSLTLCDPVDCSLPGSSVHGIFQA